MRHERDKKCNSGKSGTTMRNVFLYLYTKTKPHDSPDMRLYRNKLNYRANETQKMGQNQETQREIQSSNNKDVNKQYRRVPQ